MTPQQIMDLALANTHTKSAQVDSANLLRWFNITRKNMANFIIQNVGENYFYTEWLIDAVADQANGEYDFPVVSSLSAIKKIQRVYIKGYSDNDVYTVCKEVSIQDLKYGWDYYLQYQPKDEPIYYIVNDKIRIAPQFEDSDLSGADNDQIKIVGIPRFTDLAADAAASTVLIPDDQQWRLSLGMEQFIFKNRGKRNLALAAKNEYEVEKLSMIDELTNRDQSVMIAKIPDERSLEYGE